MGETFQGVETASQIRYVGYYEQIKKVYYGSLPPPMELQIREIEITSIAGFFFSIYVLHIIFIILVAKKAIKVVKISKRDYL